MNKLKHIKNIKFFPSCDLRKYSTLKLKENSDVIEVYSKEALQQVISCIDSYDVLGAGSNQILYSGKTYIKYCEEMDMNNLDISSKSFNIPAGNHLKSLTAFAIKNNLAGWEVFTGIPANLGGAIFMNAGTSHGEIATILKEVHFINENGKSIHKKIEPHDFSYRKNNFMKKGDIIYSAILNNFGSNEGISVKIKNYLKKRTQTQPLNDYSCGCVFKNISDVYKAGKTIDELGLKGLKRGNVAVSMSHANFVVTNGEAGASEYIEFITELQNTIKEKTGLKFEFEVKF